MAAPVDTVRMTRGSTSEWRFVRARVTIKTTTTDFTVGCGDIVAVFVTAEWSSIKIFRMLVRYEPGRRNDEKIHLNCQRILNS